MNEHWGLWGLALLLATVRTGGGGYVGGDAEATHDFIGRDQNIVNAPQSEWRLEVAARLREQDIRMAHIERASVYQNVIWFVITLVFVLVLIVGAGFIVRRFDYIEAQFATKLEVLGWQFQRQIDRLERRMDGMRIP